MLVIQPERLFRKKQTLVGKSTLSNRTVHVEARGQEDRAGAETLRRAARHCGMHTIGAGFVGGGGHYAAPIGRAANDDGLAAVLGVIPLLDAGVEGYVDTLDKL